MRLIGTIVKVGDLLCKDETSIDVKYAGSNNTLIHMLKNREYIVPDFQREIRWREENLIELLDDINKSNKFLGNIILAKTQTGDFEIIDGQQRITVLTMIMQFLTKFSNEIDVFEFCQLRIRSFEGFSNLLASNFDFNELNLEDQQKIRESDFYNQIPQYVKLWNIICNSSHISNADLAEDYIKNLKRSEVNVIINDAPEDYSMDYFLDVNLKGVRLDSEDIFKAILFSRDKSKEIREFWKILKHKHEELKTLSINFPLMTNIEHCCYISLLGTELQGIRIDSNFKIIEDVKTNTKFYHKGEHILNVIVNKSVSKTMIEFAIKVCDLFIRISNLTSPDTWFQSQFRSSEKIDSTEIKVLFFFMKNIIKEKNTVPKLILIRYLKDVLWNDDNVTKTRIRSLYTIVFYSVLFTLFKTRKDIKPIVNLVCNDDWIELIYEECLDFLRSKVLPKKVITTQYDEIENDQYDDELSFKCKMLAIFYNYFCISKSNIFIIRKGQMPNIVKMISDNSSYSIEHFALNKCKKIYLTENLAFDIPQKYNKFIGNTFNFIFVSSKLNNDLMNYEIHKKIDIIKQRSSEVLCEYSLVAIEAAELSFQKCKGLKSSEDWDVYFKVSFESEYFNYVQRIIESLSGRW